MTALIEKATSFEAEDRFQTAEEMLNAIRHPEFIDGGWIGDGERHAEQIADFS